MIGISAAQLRAIPEVIAVAYSTTRSPALQSVIRGGLIKSVVTPLIPGKEPARSAPNGLVVHRWRQSTAAPNP